jgi:hypothetical protein
MFGVLMRRTAVVSSWLTPTSPSHDPEIKKKKFETMAPAAI